MRTHQQLQVFSFFSSNNNLNSERIDCFILYYAFFDCILSFTRCNSNDNNNTVLAGITVYVFKFWFFSISFFYINGNRNFSLIFFCKLVLNQLIMVLMNWWSIFIKHLMSLIFNTQVSLSHIQSFLFYIWKKSNYIIILLSI